jgi:uncharacterized protein YgbK (DUF1537 family)
MVRRLNSGWQRSQTLGYPLVVGAPALGRYVVFGHLFARAGDEIVRLDRHPTMRVHPSTPMHESDLRRHLGMQTALSTGTRGRADARARRASGQGAHRAAS